MSKALNKRKDNAKGRWTIDKIEKGILEFFDRYHKYPTTLDFDKVDFLPSSRLIQRNFGGIVKLKEVLKINDVKNCSKGEYRSKIAKAIYNESVEYEQIFYKFLITKFPEISVHEHKILRPGHICCDFFIYTSTNKGFAIDIFYAKDTFSLTGVVNIKCKRYATLNFPIYFILVGNNFIKQCDIDVLLYNKKNMLPNNIKVITEEEFKNTL